MFTDITRSTKPYRHVIKAVFIFNFILQFETKPTSPALRSLSIVLQKFSLTEVLIVLQKFLQKFLQEYHKMGETIHMKDLTLLEWALLKLVYAHIRFVLLPSLIAATFTDALGLRRYRIDCPGDRYGNCKRWRKVHINCLCSRGFDHVTKQLGETSWCLPPKTWKRKGSS